MAGTKEIKRRIKSIKSTKKITKAMELVSASKMRRAISNALSSRLYARYSWEILNSIGENVESITDPLFVGREEVKNVLLLLITSNRGFCGAYNAQVIKKTINLLKSMENNVNIKIVTIGKKGDMAMRRLGRDIIANFPGIPDNLSLSDIIPISELSMNEYALLNCDKVYVAYTDFVSPLLQKPNIKQVIPVSKIELKELIENIDSEEKAFSSPAGKREAFSPGISSSKDYLFEGNKDALIKSLAEKLIRMQIYQMMLESNASEQSARMIAMKNASEAAGEMIDDLTLAFNKARQAGITREISEISAGMVSVN